MKKWSFRLVLGVAAVAVAIEIVSAPVEWLWPYTFGGNTQWQGQAVGRCVSLTFDDGPSQYTEAVLDILKKHDVLATFFVIGAQVEKHQKTIKRMAIEGHEIGNHTYSLYGTRGLNKLYTAVDEGQVTRTQNVVEAFTGASPHFFRSPGGQMGRGLWQLVYDHDLEVVYGTLPFPNPEDDADTQMKTALETVRPGAIFILHDGDDRHPASDRPKALVGMLPRLLDTLKSDGHKIVPLEELLYQKQC